MDVTIDDDQIQETTDVSEAEAYGGEDTDEVYANAEKAEAEGETLHSQRGDSSDEVDPRRLLRDPTLSELRWYYRREMGGILVKKPIKDAFKNGFEFTGENADEAQSLIDQPRFKKRDGYSEAHQMAEIKARRDGFSLLFLGTQDDSDGIHQSPIGNDVTVDSISHLSVLTVDDLTDSGVVHDQIQNGTGLDQTDYEVRHTGIVVNTDVSSPEFGNPIGYVLDTTPVQFIHADRVVHYVWNEDVDGDYDTSGYGIDRFSDEETLGMWEGDSVLIPSYDLLKGISKGNWAVMQALFRNASHMYSITLPPDANEEDLEAGVEVTQNINSKSALLFPDGWEATQHESGNELDPTNFYEVVFDQICANHEMTKSVLFGTQSGTVSGSETDIKNYFNKVERYRTNRGESKIIEYLTLAKRMIDSRTSDDFVFAGVDVDWGPLFKVDNETRLQMMQTQAQALTTLLGSYALTPDEVREIISEEWADIDVDSLSQDQMDTLDRVNMANMGQARVAEANDPSPDVPGNGGGRPEGAQQSSENSETTPNTDELSEDFVETLADRVAEKMTVGDD